MGSMMRVTATVAAGNGPDAYALRDRLNRRHHDGRGRSGGAAALLVRKVYDWLMLRRNAGALHVRYTRADGTELELKVDRAQDRAELMDRARMFLESGDE